jgi:hypothetical protein
MKIHTAVLLIAVQHLIRIQMEAMEGAVEGRERRGRETFSLNWMI